jgi:O-antigen ligase
MVLGTRSLSYWLQIAGLSGAAGITSDTESDPSNTIYLAGVIVAAILVLLNRQCSWASLTNNNKALFLLYLFFALSSFWSPNSFITLRRVLKDFGCVVVAAVILTDARPWFACRILFVRIAYVLLPLSLLVAKYFPNIGRYRARAGDTEYCGLTTHKNTLGQMVLICLLFLLWDLTEISEELPPSELRKAKRIRYVVIAIGLVLMVMAQSATAQICLILGCFLFFAFKRLAKNPRGRRIFRNVLFAAIVLGVANTTLGISAAVAELFGRNMTLTGRTEIWNVAMKHQTHPFIGYGFYVFWDTDIAATIYDELGDFIHIRTVHNGYLEVFIDGGITGAILLGAYLLSTGRVAYLRLFERTPSLPFPLAMWCLAMVYNNSESSFFRLDMLWFTFIVLTIDYPTQIYQAGIARAPAHVPLS